MILGLDLATKTGWCLWHDGKPIESGVQDFSKRRGESNGLMFLRFRKWLSTFIADQKITFLAYEMAHMRGGAATEIALGLQTHAQSIAAEFKILSAPVHTATLKKFACGHGKADKVMLILAAGKVLGRKPIDDNEADAVHVAHWADDEFFRF